jgi:hypothetical protein
VSTNSSTHQTLQSIVQAQLPENPSIHIKTNSAARDKNRIAHIEWAVQGTQVQLSTKTGFRKQPSPCLTGPSFMKSY